MSEQPQIETYEAEANAPINDYVPSEGVNANPPTNLKEFAQRRIVIHAASVIEGSDYPQAQMVITTDQSPQRVNAMSYSKYIIAATRDMIARKALPCQVRLVTSGQALHFAQA